MALLLHYYSAGVLAVLMLMILTGAARSVVVKLFYQSGFDNPYFVTLLYLVGRGLSLFLFLIWEAFLRWGQQVSPTAAAVVTAGQLPPTMPSPEPTEYAESEESDVGGSAALIRSATYLSLSSLRQQQPRQPPSTVTARATEPVTRQRRPAVAVPAVVESSSVHRSEESEGQLAIEPDIETMIAPPPQCPGEQQPAQHMMPRIGSRTGLSSMSHNANQWIHVVPYWLLPAIPGFFNFTSSACKWGAFAFVAASIAEMLMNGFELVVSVLASRFIRKRLIPKTRWVGVGIVVAGLFLVGTAGLFDDDVSTARSQPWIGIVLIVAEVVLAVLQDLVEELFMQELDYPALLLLGLESVYGLVIAIPLYWLIGPFLGDVPGEVWRKMSTQGIFYILGLLGIFLLAGIFQIMATGVTSTMTASVWKNFRGLLVWIAGLMIYYLGGSSSGDQSSDLGEAWLIPQSLFILIGFSIMLVGLGVYYRRPKRQQRPETDEQATGGDSLHF